MSKIPTNHINYKSTKIFNKDNIPQLLLYSHNTKAGVYGEIVVLTGKLKFYGLKEHKGEVEKELIIKSGETAISPPQYWHRVEFLTHDTTFKINFYADKDSDTARQSLWERGNI